MANIEQYGMQSGRLLGEDGQVHNVVDLLGGGSFAGLIDPQYGRYTFVGAYEIDMAVQTGTLY